MSALDKHSHVHTTTYHRPFRITALGPVGVAAVGIVLYGMAGRPARTNRTCRAIRAFRERYHATFRRQIACDSRETVPAALAIVRLAGGDPRLAASFGANFGRDTDTIACMAAGICGALSGILPLNAELIERLPAQAQRAQADLASRLAVITCAKMESELKAVARCPIDAP